jgi:ADP-ribose pyrophosphatase YjhB (NUDIX family)
VVVVQNGRLLAFRAADPTSGKEYFFLPGGMIKEDETAPESAERVTLESTGFRVQVTPTSNTDREHGFHWDGEDFDCLTIFYRATLLSAMQSQIVDADYSKGTHWIPLAEVPAAFDYSAETLSAIKELIESF